MTQGPELIADPRPRLGLIVLQADETIEDDFRRLFAPSAVQIHVSRVPSGAELTPKTIAEMEHALPAAAALFPQGAPFDVVAYACTSGTSQIGADRVRALVQSACHTSAVTNPLTASLVRLGALGAQRIGIFSPYVPEVAETMERSFEAAGLAVGRTLSFGEEREAKVARIAPSSIKAAALKLGEDPGLDAIFLSCTNLRTLDVIPELEAALQRPVLSSNLALAWHMAKLAGVRLPPLAQL